MSVNEMLMAAAGQAGGAAEYVEDVFSTYLYSGTGATQTITNNIDLAGEGGLVWLKRRTSVGGTAGHRLFDSDSGGGDYLFLQSNATAAQSSYSSTNLSAFNANGFTLQSDGSQNGSGDTYCSWTFRKAPKFFDVVTWTGNGSAAQTISHNLGSTPGFIITKKTSSTSAWYSYHRGIDNANQKGIRLNLTNTPVNIGVDIWNPTSTTFQADSNLGLCDSGATYVAYLFAHNAGGFGAAGTDNIISCGSYTGTGAAGNAITLGYEPQYVLIKAASGTSASLQDWYVYDVMRGMPNGSDDARLMPNLSDAEGSFNEICPSATGFICEASGARLNESGSTYIYMAIRRPMKTPTSGTSVFAPVAAAAGSSTTITTNFPVDMVLLTDRSTSWVYNTTAEDRLRGGTIASITSSTDAERTDNASKFDSNVSFVDGWSNLSTRNIVYYAFRRAPSFFDEVCYTGTGSATTVTHNLGVVPELIIVKSRSNALPWNVYCAPLGSDKRLRVNTTDASQNSSDWNSTTPTSSVFSVGSFTGTNGSGQTHVAYLFATLSGVSKVGSYTGTGSTQTINCGFTGGARFVLIKRTDDTGDWYVWDTARGIVSGNDPYLLLNSSAAEVTNTDYIDPANSGFEISSTAPAAINANGGSFIFLAIA